MWAQVDTDADVLGCMATDMWRSSSAARGTPLMNTCLLLPHGGSIFFEAEAVGDVRKNAEWIADKHEELAQRLTDGKLDKLAGVIMDNTSANRKAMGLLEQRQPQWLAIGCQAHALDLFLKDLGKPAKAPWAAGVLQQVREVSKVSIDLVVEL